MVGVAPESDRELAHLLDQVKGRSALLLTNDIAQNAAEQADIVDKGLVFVVLARAGHAWSPKEVRRAAGAAAAQHASIPSSSFPCAAP